MDVARVHNVVQRIGIENEKIGKLSGFDGTNVGKPVRIGIPFGRRLNDFHPRHADIFLHDGHFLMHAQPGSRLSDVGGNDDLSTGFHEAARKLRFL